MNTPEKTKTFIPILKSIGSEYILDKVLNDLTNRKGFVEIWYSIDKETQESIKESWRIIIEHAIDNAYQMPERGH